MKTFGALVISTRPVTSLRSEPLSRTEGRELGRELGMELGMELGRELRENSEEKSMFFTNFESCF